MLRYPCWLFPLSLLCFRVQTGWWSTWPYVLLVFFFLLWANHFNQNVIPTLRRLIYCIIFLSWHDCLSNCWSLLLQGNALFVPCFFFCPFFFFFLCWLYRIMLLLPLNRYLYRVLHDWDILNLLIVWGSTYPIPDGKGEPIYYHQPYQWSLAYQSNQCLPSTSTSFFLYVKQITSSSCILRLVVSYHRITNAVLEVLKIFQNRAFTCEYKWVLINKRIWFLNFRKFSCSCRLIQPVLNSPVRSSQLM